MVGRLAFGIALLLSLGGCDREGSYQPEDGGRYRGIGIASPGKQWTKLADAPKPGDAKTATLADDDYVVFVTDSQTGEVRECGNRSGFCIRFQPWQRPAPLAPLALTNHADAALVENASEPAAAVTDTLPEPARAH